MTATGNEAIVRNMFRDAMERGDFDSAMDAYDTDVVYHNPAMAEMPNLPPGKEGMRMLMSGSRAAFPDLAYTIEVLVAEEDYVALLYSWTATHLGGFGGLPATGKHVSATGAIFCRLANGRIVEQWDIDDRLAVVQQLGIPSEALTS